jgi:hypothetical protein
MYWNSMSESFIPTSLWEQTRDNPDLQLFEAMDASLLREMMHDAFMASPTMRYNYLLEPFSLVTCINYKKSFDPLKDSYRYMINALIQSININLSPTSMRDILKFQAFLEMSSYHRELVRFKPPLRPLHYIENPPYRDEDKKKKSKLIGDWFRVALWFVRLRNAAKGRTPFSLLELEHNLQT